MVSGCNISIVLIESRKFGIFVSNGWFRVGLRKYMMKLEYFMKLECKEIF